MELEHGPGDNSSTYPLSVRALEDIHVTADGSLFRGWRLCRETFRRSRYPHPTQWQELHWYEKLIPLARLYMLPYLHRLFPMRRDAMPEDVFFVSHQWGTCYYHWLIDHFATLFALRNQHGNRPLRLLLSKRLAGKAFVTETLRLVDVEPVVLPGHVRMSSLSVATAVGTEDLFHTPTLHALRDRFRATYAPTETGQRLYISRSLARKRRVVNEQEILPVLQKHGFRICHFEQLSFGEQVRLAAGASVILGAHGAGLTNMLFMSPESLLIELRPRSFNNDCFAHVADALGHRYSLLALPEAFPRHDMHIDPLVLDTHLSRVLSA